MTKFEIKPNDPQPTFQCHSQHGSIDVKGQLNDMNPGNVSIFKQFWKHRMFILKRKQTNSLNQANSFSRLFLNTVFLFVSSVDTIWRKLELSYLKYRRTKIDYNFKPQVLMIRNSHTVLHKMPIYSLVHSSFKLSYRMYNTFCSLRLKCYNQHSQIILATSIFIFQ